MYAPDQNRQQIEDIYKLTRENNQMLHGMRRSAFFWTFAKIIIYGIFFAAPIWFYMTYLSGTMDQLVNTMNQVKSMSGASQKQFTGFEDGVKHFKEKLPLFLQGYVPNQQLPATSATTTNH